MDVCQEDWLSLALTDCVYVWKNVKLTFTHFWMLQAGTVLVIKEPDSMNKEANPPPAPHRPRAEPAAKKSRAQVKPPQDPDAVFPCKKCGR